MVFVVFPPVLVLPVLMLFNSIGKLWILFLSMVATLGIVTGEDQVECFQYLVFNWRLLWT